MARGPLACSSRGDAALWFQGDAKGVLSAAFPCCCWGGIQDVDIVWLGDPFPFFQGDFDLWVQEDSGYLPPGHRVVSRHLPQEPAAMFEPFLCTCFMMVRPTEGSKTLMNRWSSVLRQRVSPPKPTLSLRHWHPLHCNKTPMSRGSSRPHKRGSS